MDALYGMACGAQVTARGGETLRRVFGLFEVDTTLPDPTLFFQLVDYAGAVNYQVCVDVNGVELGATCP